MQASRSRFPAAALDWLTVRPQQRVLNVAGSAMLPVLLTEAGHAVINVNKDALRARALSERGIVSVAAQAESLPFESSQFNVVTVNQSLHRFAVGVSLSEFARVLRPDGCLSVSYLVRDDSVPWVRRLADLVRHYDPAAMRGDYGTQALHEVERSKYFPTLDTRVFRLWQSVPRRGLVDMVLAQPLARHLADPQRQRLIGDVQTLYDESAGLAEDLKLPFRLHCWRAWVSHDELTAPVHMGEDALHIRL